jgi:uncharacterized protein YkwD
LQGAEAAFMRRFGLLAILALTLGLVLAASASASLRSNALAGKPAALRVLSAPSASCAGADDPNATIGLQKSAMTCLLNYARSQAGVGRLSEYNKLDGSADNKAGDILRCNQFSHDACGRDFTYWMRRAGYMNAKCWWAGENLAWGTGSLGSARSIMQAWLRSPEHRANLLSTNFSQYGISLRVGGLSGNSNAHVWVNHFGRHC